MANDFNSFLQWMGSQGNQGGFPPPGQYSSPIPGYGIGGTGGFAPFDTRPWDVQPGGYVGLESGRMGNYAQMPGMSGNPGELMQQSMNAWSGPGSQLGGMPPMLLGALGRDIGEFQGAADQQHDLFNQQVVAPFQEMMQGMPGQVQDAGNQAAEQVEGFGQQAMEMGQEQQAMGMEFLRQLLGQTMPQMDDLRGRLQEFSSGIPEQIQGVVDQYGQDVTQRVDQADALAGEAVEWAKKAAGGFADRAAQDASAAAAAIQRTAASAMKQAKKGLRMDGTPMSPGEQSAAVQEIQGQTAMQVQGAITPLMSKYNEIQANLNMAVSQTFTSSAGVKLNGAQILSDAHAKMGGLLSQAGQLQLGAMEAEGAVDSTMGQLGVQYAQVMDQFNQAARWGSEMAGNMLSQGAQFRNAATMNAVNLEMQGYQMTADFIRSNPESVVSWFDGLLSIFATMSAQQGKAVVA